MLEAPINRNPARPPRLEANLLGPRGVAAVIENIEILPRENVPIALEKRQSQIFGQRFEGAPIVGVVRINGIVINPRTNKVVVARIIQISALETRGRHFVHPQSLDPSVADVAGVRGSGHAAKSVRSGATVAGSKKLPLLESEMRQLVDADKDKFGALIAVDVVFVAAVAETCRRAVVPGDDALGFVVAAVKIVRHIAAKVRQQRRFQLRISAPEKQRVRSGHSIRLENGLPEQ